MTNSLASELRMWFYLFGIMLSLCPSQPEVGGSRLENVWGMQDPIGKMCLMSTDPEDALSNSFGTNRTACEDSSSAIRMEYEIHKKVKHAKYQIFQTDCKDRFEDGKSPVRSSVSPNQDNTIPLSLSSESSDTDSITASLELIPNKDSLSSSWFQSFFNTELQQRTIEFCVRTSLYTPPQAGDIEVNFRETNIVAVFNTTEGDGGNGDDYVVDSVVLNPKELIGIKVELNSKMNGETSASTKKNDEL